MNGESFNLLGVVYTKMKVKWLYKSFCDRKRGREISKAGETWQVKSCSHISYSRSDTNYAFKLLTEILKVYTFLANVCSDY